MELLSGGEMIMRALKEEQVKMIFGYPGGAVLHIYDALYQQDAVEHILVRHEQAAVHAADGFSRSTGEVGVALVTSGPGGDKRNHRHRDRLHGFDTSGRHLRKRPEPFDG